jgi:alkanesulfonate monooxygenase SsuD/methylene tetrahydromethanopterin reductase-like flavin-dependent oxidoreductase (luciferase family)
MTAPTPALAGLYLPQIRMDFATIEERARAAEEVGFHSVWFMDHLAPPGGRQLDVLDAWTVATAVAVRTERIHIGHLVLAAPFHHPAVLAKMAATLDVISGGRLELGLGWGSVPQELVDYGVTTDGPAIRSRQLAEMLELLGRLWSGEPVDFDGDHWTLRGAVCRPRPIRGRVPIHIGGAGPKLTMPLVARYADWWNCPSTAMDQFSSLRPQAGDVRVSVQHVIGLAPSSARRDEVVEVTNRRFRGWGGVVAGTPDEVAEVLRPEREAGAELFICQFHDFALPETLRLFADEVLPALA